MLKQWIAKCRKALTRFEQSERGIAAIEFAMLAPPFFVLLGAIFETGAMFFTEYTLQTAVQDASRLVRTGQAQSSPLSADQFKAKVCNLVSVLVDCSNGVTVYVRSDTNFTNLQANLPNFLTIGPSIGNSQTANKCYNPGPAGQPSAVVATYDWTFSMWGMSAFSNINAGATRRLVGFAIFRNEPFPSATTSSC